MTCSPAQLASNRKNALRSTGPITIKGKAISRANSLKHGLTGEGIVLANEDAAEIERRFASLEIAMAPRNELAVEVVKRVALLTVRLDRSAEHEAKAISFRMRHAAEEFDDARLAKAEEAFSWIAHNPPTNARRLRSSPEGLMRLIQEFEAMQAEILHPDGVNWGMRNCEQLHHLLGLRRVDAPISRLRAFSDAIDGDFQYLRPSDGAGLNTHERKCWAVQQLLDFLDEQIAAHKALLDKFDLSMIELDRAEAASRAYFDASKEAILARKYEGAAERGLYRALREFREIQAEAAALAESMAQQQLEAKAAEELGSSLPEPSEVENEEADVDEIAVEIAEPAVEVSVFVEKSVSADRIWTDETGQSPG